MNEVNILDSSFVTSTEVLPIWPPVKCIKQYNSVKPFISNTSLLKEENPEFIITIDSENI